MQHISHFLDPKKYEPQTDTTKYFIYPQLGAVFFLQNNELHACPISSNNTFDLDESYIVDTWNDVEKRHQLIVKTALGVTSECQHFGGCINGKHDWRCVISREATL